MQDEAPYVFLKQVGTAVANSTERAAQSLREETDAKLREQSDRLDRIEALIGVEAKYRHILEHELHELAVERITSGDEQCLYEFAETKGISFKELRSLMDEYLRIR